VRQGYFEGSSSLLFADRKCKLLSLYNEMQMRWSLFLFMFQFYSIVTANTFVLNTGRPSFSLLFKRLSLFCPAAL
jgi:hypothetical protein